MTIKPVSNLICMACTIGTPLILSIKICIQWAITLAARGQTKQRSYYEYANNNNSNGSLYWVYVFHD